MGIHRSLIARPLAEKSVLRAACLDGFDHFNARYGGGFQLARVTHLYAGDIDASVGNDAGNDNIHDQREKPDQRQHRTLPQHQDKVKNHHSGIEQEGRKGSRQRSSDGGVHGSAGLDISRQPLREKFHRQVQHLPHICRTAANRHFSVNPQRIDRLYPRHDDLHRRQQDHDENKR